MFCDATEPDWKRFAAYTPQEGPDAPLLRLETLGHFLSSGAYYVRREGLDQWLLAYTRTGQGRLVYRGESYALTPGSAFLIHCGERQEYRTEGCHWEFLWVHFSGMLADSFAQYVQLKRGVVAQGGGELPSLWEKAFTLADQNGPDCGARISAVLYEMLTQLLVARPTDARIEAAIAYMRAHASESVRMEDLAQAACMSPYHFQRRFHKEMGVPPHLYLNRYRISQAKQLLATTDLPIATVAEQTGFSTPSHLSDTFRKITGMTPGEYRRSMRTFQPPVIF